jgi:hypothetical protein
MAGPKVVVLVRVSISADQTSDVSNVTVKPLANLWF